MFHDNSKSRPSLPPSYFKKMEIHLKLTGVLLIILSMIHLIFPRYFDWRKEFLNVSHINREMMYVHTFFIGLMVFLNGLLCLTSTNELINTVLGKRICFGLGIFWTTRLLIQFFGYSSIHWRGKKFETSMHVLFSFLWIYISIVFFACYLQFEI